MAEKIEKADDIPLGHGIRRDPDTGRYSFVCKGMTHGEALELLAVLRRLELYRTVGVETDIVESAMRTMSSIEVGRL